MNAGTGQDGSVLEALKLDGDDGDRSELNPKLQT
jgi:hypothetical protein